MSAPRRLRLRIRGLVQGVGFRPFVRVLARRLGLAGHVLNDAEGVVVEVEGAALDAFVIALRAEAPPLARIETLDATAIPATGEQGFAIRPSRGGAVATRIGTDTATCGDCLRELADPASRFHAYPFITCTHCGPRYTITHALPYDRPQTSMAGFAMCPDCARDYADPDDRRYHAETIACDRCGPRLSIPPGQIAQALRAGRIVALKGIGGYHLMADARDAGAVARLRQRKARDAKPFALMVADLAALEAIARPTAAERALVSSAARPIVLMTPRPGLPEALAPGLNLIGVMLAYAPVHHLIFAAGAPSVLVATSANPGGAPVITDDAEALRVLPPLADLIVTHDRAILTRADDSVARVIAGAAALLRRARGFVPEPVDLGQDGPPVLAFGAHLKATVTLTRGREAFVSQHIGSLTDAATRRFYAETLAHLRAILAVSPEIAVCDLHPDYASTRAAEASGLALRRVQHHAAHLAAIAAEHGLTGPVFGLALDGHGLGDDGGAWGGEAMLVHGAQWRRLGHLAPLALPGGDRAAREPWRMGLAALSRLGLAATAAARWPDAPVAQMAAMLARAPGTGTTTSAGRLFDAAAALLGLSTRQAYEGQAAMLLEAQVRAPVTGSGLYHLADGVLDFAPLLRVLATAPMSPGEGADLFHGALIDGLADWAAALAPAGVDVALGGGCLANRVLAEGLAGALRDRGLRPRLAQAVPAGDGGLSLGQAALGRAWAAAGMAQETAFPPRNL